MAVQVLTALGGVGLFLLGMQMLTGGLRGLAGAHLRRALSHFTATPLSGAVTGALSTALIQSSSATTVTAIGFVAAGLLSFPQALGIIFGANIGTTMTGWLVAILGFKLDLGQIVLPLVLLGALLQLLAKGRAATIGRSLAGFSLLFIGIEVMKDGLAAFEGIVTPEAFPRDTVSGRLMLVGIGIAITLVTQSSSAGVATALAALGAGAINLPQAAALVIGMDVGTTFTALLATVGGSTVTKRTGAAHVIYNVMTGAMAFVLLPFAIAGFTAAGVTDPQIALVAFHSAFNLLGVVLVLPFAGQFARLIAALIPETGPALTRRLDPQLLGDFHLAQHATAGTASELADTLAAHLAHLLRPPGHPQRDAWDSVRIRNALDETRDYLDRTILTTRVTEEMAQITPLLHALDHLSRLLYRADQGARVAALWQDRDLSDLAARLGQQAEAAVAPADGAAAAHRLHVLTRLLRRRHQTLRDVLIERGARGEIDTDEVARRLDALRWLYRTADHLWRIRVHLNELEPDAGASARRPQS